MTLFLSNFLLLVAPVVMISGQRVLTVGEEARAAADWQAGTLTTGSHPVDDSPPDFSNGEVQSGKSSDLLWTCISNLDQSIPWLFSTPLFFMNRWICVHHQSEVCREDGKTGHQGVLASKCLSLPSHLCDRVQSHAGEKVR